MRPVFKPRPRESWSEHPHVGFTHADWQHAPRTVRVHHTAGPQPRYTKTSAKKNKAAERQLLVDTERFHIEVRKYAAIGYSYLIMPSGRVYEGRGFEALGAHTLGHNEDVGACFPGNFEVAKPTVRALVGYWRLRRYLRKRGVKIVGHASHSDTFSTSCCGRHLKQALKL